MYENCLEHKKKRRAASASLVGLCIQLSTRSAAFIFFKFRAVRVHANPQAGKTPEEIVDATGKKSGTFGVDAGHASEMHERRDGKIGDGGRVRLGCAAQRERRIRHAR